MQKYITLLRINQPIGFLLLMMPCFWGILAATRSLSELITLYPVFLLFAIGSIVMRSAGCIINDIFDRKLDASVKRTATRPLASGSMSVFTALTIFAILCLIGLAILLSLKTISIIIGLCSFILFMIYPLMKRITYWPQLFLGLTFNVGVLIAYSSVSSSINIEIISLYISGIFWTLGYDTIYAHQDREDDLKIGIKSTAILFGKNTKLWISLFYTIMLTFLIFYGILSTINLYYYIALIFVGLHLINQIIKLDINDSDVCLKLFKSNSVLGLLICASLLTNIL